MMVRSAEPQIGCWVLVLDGAADWVSQRAQTMRLSGAVSVAAQLHNNTNLNCRGEIRHSENEFLIGNCSVKSGVLKLDH
jgi:hypothetical protein